jgi:hypothetical protein
LSKFGFEQKTEEQNILLKYSGGTTEIEAKIHQNFYASPLDGDRGFFIG